MTAAGQVELDGPQVFVVDLDLAQGHAQVGGAGGVGSSVEALES